MKIQKKYVIVLFACLSFHFMADAEAKSYSSEAASEASSARISSLSARGASQVSQLHDEAQTEIQVLLVKQLDEVLKLLEHPNSKDSATSESLDASKDSATSESLDEITKMLKTAIADFSNKQEAANLEAFATSESLDEITKMLKTAIADFSNKQEAANLEASATSKTPDEITGVLKPAIANFSKKQEVSNYISYGVITIGIILILQLSLILSKLKNKQAEQDSGGNG